MKYLLLSLFTLFLAIAIGSVVVKDSGYMVLSILGWKIETSAILFFIVIFLFFILVYFLIRSLVRALQLPKDIRIWKENKKQYLSEKYISDGLVDMTDGNWKEAESKFCKAASNSKNPYIMYLYAARTAEKMSALKKRDKYLRLAHTHNSDAALTIGLTQAELQLNQGQTVQAIAILNNLQEKWPDQIRIKQLLLEAYTFLNDWQAVIELLCSIEKNNSYTHDVIEDKKINAYVGLLKDAGISKDKKKLNKLWGEIPRKFKHKHHLIEAYISERLKFEDTIDCEVLLKDAIKRQWDRKLVQLYGLVIAKDLDKQLHTAESWLGTYANDPVLLLALGRICIRNSLWSKAKEYLQKSVDIQKSSDTFFQFANLYQHQGDYKQAAIYYEKGLTLISEEK